MDLFSKVGIIFILLAVCVWTVLFFRNKDTERVYLKLAIGVMVVVPLILAARFYIAPILKPFLATINEKNNYMDDIRENSENFTFYLDGKEVEYETIDIDQYSVSYDKEKNVVYLTQKDDKNDWFLFIPIFWR